MPITPGTKLGPYEIVAPLGAGGMGEVYRAKDTRLGRDVAVKVLPQHLSANPEIRTRFEREAKTVSSLNHPNICTLFDVGREGDTDYLVMELIEGETLSARIARGPLASSEVLRLGAQIADALDRAHRAGVVHRDLKPGNVMLTKSGAKLMDFGLARATGLAGPVSGSASGSMTALTQSPTVAQALTAEGTLVGTFQYMSPEQLEGKEADTRSDVWALGCVLYEMATGRRAYQGKSQATLISAIMTSEPPSASTITPSTPPALSRLIAGCLDKEPENRVQTAHDVKLQLEWIREAGSQASATAPVHVRRRTPTWLPWAVAGIAFVAAIAAIFLPRGAASGKGAIVAAILPADGTTLSPFWGHLALSPDGRTIAFCAEDSVGQAIWVRPVGSDQPRLVHRPQTLDAGPIGWSPDSKQLCFFADKALQRLTLETGVVQRLCDAAAGRGLTWNRGGVILFTTRGSGPLVQMSSNGGDPAPATTLDATRQEASHRYPCFLPDGVHFLYAVMPPGPKGFDIYVGSLHDKAVKKVLTANSAAIYAAPGYLLFERDHRIMAQRFDTGSLQVAGDAVELGPAPERSTADAEAVASASGDGDFCAPMSTPSNTSLDWYDMGGKVLQHVAAPPGPWHVMTVSPDDSRAVLSLGEDLWILDLTRGVPIKLATTASTEATARWSPDGKQIAYVTKQSGRCEIYVTNADGSGTPKMVATTGAVFKYLTDWSPDGKSLVFFTAADTTAALTKSDIWLVPADGSQSATPILRTPAAESQGKLSPDGHWLAYMSDESGADEIYIQSFPEPGHKVRVTTAGGSFPGWMKDGKGMRFQTDGALWFVPITAGADVVPGAPRLMFKLPSGANGAGRGADDTRVLLSRASEAPRRRIQLYVNWQSGLQP